MHVINSSLVMSEFRQQILVPNFLSGRMYFFSLNVTMDYLTDALLSLVAVPG